MTDTQKKQFRFNLVDLLLILVIIAAVGAVIYIFAGNRVFGKEATEIEYTVEVTMIKNDLLPEVRKMQEGDTVIDSVRGYNLGNLVSYSLEDAYMLTTDLKSGTVKKVYFPQEPGFSRLTVTVRSQCSKQNGVYDINGKTMAVGLDVPFRTSRLVGDGYCTSITEVTK